MKIVNRRSLIALAIIFVAASCKAIEPCEADKLECVLASYDKDKYGDLRSVVVIKGGKTIVERYYNGNDSKSLVDVRSAGKSVTSLLFGIALDKQLIKNLDQKVVDYLPKSKGRDIGKVRFDHLLTMRTGLDADANNSKSVGMEDHMDASDNPFKWMLTIPNITEPGTQYVYNSLAAYTAGLVVDKATEQGLEDFARKNLFEPLNFKDWNWQKDRSGYTKGQGNLFLTAPDFARLGLMVLNGGNFNGQQIVSQSWIKESLKPHVNVSKIEFNAIGYGYYWYQQVYQVNGQSIKVHFASGNGGNKLYIIPTYNMVVSVMSTAYGQGRGHRRSEDILKAALESAES